jgi:prepilin-type N-terminal cleavage/methylation domain-containing protein
MKRFHAGVRPHAEAFTLVEVLVVVLIIGILLVIALPNFLEVRNASRAKACISNLKAIDGAKQQYILEKKVSWTITPLDTDLAPTYMRAFPACPAGGSYSIHDGNTNPTCNYVDSSFPHSLT